MEKKLACAFTGHRIEKLPFLSDENDLKYKRVRQELFCNILALTREGRCTFISGMARGVDLIAAEIVLSLRDLLPDREICLWAAIPYDRQAAAWSVKERERYEAILGKANRVKYISHEYTRACLYQRNRWMCDQATHLLAVYDGQAGGTKYTIDYARKKGLNITIIQP